MTETPTGTDLPAVIAALDDERALRALEIVVFQDRAPSPGQLPTSEELTEAATATDPTPFETAAVSEPDLARAALTYLATQPDRVSDVRKAIDLSADATTRIEPVTLIVGGLIVLALQTQISLSRDPQGHWRFTFHKHAMKDSTLGTLLGKLIGTYTAQ